MLRKNVIQGNIYLHGFYLTYLFSKYILGQNPIYFFFFFSVQLSSDCSNWFILITSYISSSSLHRVPDRLLQMDLSLEWNCRLCHSRWKPVPKCCKYSIIQRDIIWSCSNGISWACVFGMWNWKACLPLFRITRKLSKRLKHISILLWFFWIIHHANWFSSSVLLLPS